jgi:subfamily B ATP-binding cassette protein HlyB/CyaB
MSALQEAVGQLLDSHIMFSMLPKDKRSALIPLFEAKSYPPEHLISEQDKPMDGMYFVYNGTVRLKQDNTDKRISLGELNSHSTFGELSLVKDATWPYTVVASDHVTMLKLPAANVRSMISRHPDVAEVFKKQVGLVETSYRVRGLLGKAKFSPEQFSDILQHIGIKEFNKGDLVFAQGDIDPRLYYLEQGSVELIRTPLTDDDLVLDKLKPGMLFGEGGAITGLDGHGIQPNLARALTDVTVLVIPHKSVQEICTINPVLHQELQERVARFKAIEQQEIAYRQRAEGMDQRLQLADAVTEDEFLQLEKKKDIRQFPLVRQTHQSECAAACITMICRHYKKDFTLGQIRELTNLSGENISPTSIITGAESLGFNAKPYAIKLRELAGMKLPVIVGWEGYHYVVVYRIGKKDVHIADPGTGLKKISREDFIRSWTQAEMPGVQTDPQVGVAIGLDPTMKFEQQTPPKKPIYHFINYMLPYKKFYVEAMLAALAINVLGLASPLFVQTIVDNVVVHQDVTLLNMMLVGMALVTIFSTFTGAAQNLLLAHTTARIDLRMMSEFYRHVLSMPMEFFLTRNKGEILSRFGQNAKIREFIASSTVTVLLNSLMVIVYLLMMFAYSVTLTSLVLLFIPVYILLVVYYTPKIKAIAQEIFITNTQTQSHLIESLNGIEALKATANEYMARSRWESAFVENVKRVYQSSKLNLTSTSLHKLVGLSSTIAILWLGANQVISGAMTIGELMGFNMLVTLVITPINQLVGLWNKIADIRVSVDRVGEILTVKPEQEPITDPDQLPAVLSACQGGIEFSKVNFSYLANEKENYVMKDFDLAVEPGTRLALVGPSGCGKSTIAKMILGFYLPKSGECKIDGKEIKSLDLGSLRRNIGVVLQDSFLFAGTVAENIALGDPTPDMLAVTEAAHLAGAHEFVINYPLGYQTLIGEKGIGISGGQRQRICIARALYRNPKILIFDEATSALDNESEKQIQKNMESILKGRTSITIAHRLSTILESDLICYINDGKVAEKGTHAELTNPDYLKQNQYSGLYYKLAQTQFNLPALEL